MNTIRLPQWLIQLVVVVALPTVTCFGYYSLEYLGDDEAIWGLPVMLAYPVALIGMVGLFRTFRSSRRSSRALLLWTLCIIVPGALLLWLRLR
jgi:hypothetical protein